MNRASSRASQVEIQELNEQPHGYSAVAAAESDELVSCHFLQAASPGKKLFARFYKLCLWIFLSLIFNCYTILKALMRNLSKIFKKY